MNRRSFIKRAGLAGVSAMAAPMILPGRVLGMNGQPGANERLVIGMIGVGVRGRQLIRPFGESCRIAAVCDVFLPRAREVAQRAGAKYVYQDYREVLDRDDIDAVVVATPLHWHALMCIHAAQAGKDIFGEKPLSRSVEEGRRIIEAVRKYDRVFQTGSQQRSGRNEHNALTHVRNGAVGKIRKVIAYNYYSPMVPDFAGEKIPEGLDWERWLGPAEPHPFNRRIWSNSTNPSWVSLRPFSGGNMTDFGSHGLDMMQWGLGMDESGPEEVWVEGDSFETVYSTPENPGGRQQGPRSPTVFMRYPGDIVVEQTSDAGGFRAQFVGEGGSIFVGRGGFGSQPSGIVGRPMENPDVTLYRGYEYALNTSHEQDWVNAVKERRDPVAPVEAGHRSATVCHLGNIARWVSEITGETGKVLKWDAKNERFTNSPEANRFLGSTYRPGYELPEV